MKRAADHSTIPGLDSGIPSRIAIAVENPLQDDVRALIGELNAALLALTPAEFCYHLKPEEMAIPSVTVFVARIAGRAIAMGALRRVGATGEVKRMYTRPEAQGQGIAGRVLAAIEEMALAEGISELVLETGDRHAAAWRVYERAGFTRCGPILDYPQTPYSIFYQKRLDQQPPGCA
jgi:putative acetyltransferase